MFAGIWCGEAARCRGAYRIFEAARAGIVRSRTVTWTIDSPGSITPADGPAWQ
jgi:hypothetical protein